MVFFLHFFQNGFVLGDCSPPSPRVDFISTSIYYCVNYTQRCWVARQSLYRSNNLFTAVLITHKGAESPGSRRIGVISALVYFLPSETVRMAHSTSHHNPNWDYVTLATSYPRQQHDTFASPPSFSILTPTNIKKIERNFSFPSTARYHYTFPPELRPKSHTHSYAVGRVLKIKSSAWFAMGRLGPLTQTVFSFGFSFRFFSFRGCVLADRSPPSEGPTSSGLHFRL